MSVSELTAAELEKNSRHHLAKGVMWTSLVYVSLGIFFVILGRLWLMLPLNSPGVHTYIGSIKHAAMMQWIPSSMFFTIAGLTFVSGKFLSLPVEKKGRKLFVRIVALLHQPWIYLAFLAIAAIWIVLMVTAESGFGATVAGWYSIDTSTEQGTLDFIAMVSEWPYPEFMFFGFLGLLVYPVTRRSSELVLKETGVFLKKKYRLLPPRFSERAKRSAVRGLIIGGIIYSAIGGILYLLGVALTIGIDIFYPIINFESYSNLKRIYFLFPLVFGALCIMTGILYKSKPDSSGVRMLGWFTGFTQLIIPLFGWFFGMNILMDLWYSSKGRREDAHRKRVELFMGLAAAIFVILVPVFMLFMNGLNRLDPEHYRLLIDLQDLDSVAEGLAWTFTWVLILFYILAGIYLIMEAHASEVAVQKKFRRGLAFLFFSLAGAQGLGLLYSLLKSSLFEIAHLIFPHAVPLPGSHYGDEDYNVRGDTSWMLTLVCLGLVYITYCIERYISNNKRQILTKFLIGFFACGVLSIVFAYIGAIAHADWYQIGGYGFTFLPAIGVAMGLFAIIIIYGKLARQTSGQIKKNALTIIFGFLITIISTVLHVLKEQIDFPFSWMVFL
ncbi:hypothetical protein GF325_05985, partial [Candidatus Bathyarchaeota archaeon]|nr:hypothetical protein [Candidatus Bathyarchaeota archaeon]